VVPEGVVQVGGEWYFEEFARGAGVTSLGLEDKPNDTPQALPREDEKKKILDLFKIN
jgi:penicillin-binding protein 1A